MSENRNTSRQKVTKLAQELVVERIYDAPRELVFEAWSRPDYLARWWSPKGWTLPICKLDFRPGGTWHYQMLGPNGEESWGKAVYQEIVRPERIVFADAFSDADGNVNAKMPQALITVELEEHEGGATKQISRSRYESPDMLDKVLAMGMVDGMTLSMNQLDELLEALQAERR
jgi:uncharacterized protein YndB with AHSA1/START domain